jgi:hypothetical protein
MDNTQSDSRKYKCLVALLSKHRIFSIEEAISKQQLFPGISLDLAARAVEEAKLRATPKWEKRIKKLLVEGLWTPARQEWLPFEELRDDICGHKLIAYEKSCLVWSPVEVWVCIRSSSSRRVVYLRSQLTDEVYYAHYTSSRWRIVSGGNDTILVANRSAYSGSITGTTAQHIIDEVAKNGQTPSETIKKVLLKAQFE